MSAAQSRMLCVEAPSSESEKSRKYPEDCSVWLSDGDVGSQRFNRYDPDPAQTLRCCTRYFLTCPEGRRPDEERIRAAGHDQTVTLVFINGATYFVRMLSTAGPHRRFRDYGPCAVLSLYSDDQVVLAADWRSGVLTRDVPCATGTVVFVSWKRGDFGRRLRHVAVVPGLIAAWPSN